MTEYHVSLHVYARSQQEAVQVAEMLARTAVGLALDDMHASMSIGRSEEEGTNGSDG